jgi:hypothetical protein
MGEVAWPPDWPEYLSACTTAPRVVAAKGQANSGVRDLVANVVSAELRLHIRMRLRRAPGRSLADATTDRRKRVGEARFMLHMAACRLKVSDADRAVLVMRSPPLT